MLDPLIKGYLALRPASAARTLAQLDDRDLHEIFMAMPHQLAADVLGHMAPGAACRCIAQLPAVTGSKVLAHTPVLPAVAALRLMPQEQVITLLEGMPSAVAARLRLRLRYSETLIGSYVDSDVITFTPAHHVGDALRLLRHSGRNTGQAIPVLDGQRQLAGVVDISDILVSRDRGLIQNIMRPPSLVLYARSSLQTVADHPAWLTNDSLPVINRIGVFQGVLRRQKVMEEEQQLLSEVADRADLAMTRAALADIFWMGVGAVLVGDNHPASRKQAED